MAQDRPKIVIAGGSGFIGRALLAEFLSHGYDLVVLSRTNKPMKDAEVAAWDGRTPGNWVDRLDGAKAVVNLSGEPITLRWTEENRKKILESRTESTRALGEAIAAVARPPEVWVNASGIGYYGDTGDDVKDESSPPGHDFTAQVCVAWEGAQSEAATPNTRKVAIRTGFVLGRDGGAFPQLAKLTKAFLGGAVGNGRQWAPWIDLRDLVRLFRWTVESEVQGPVNGCGPNPVRNGELMEAMRRAAHRPWSPPAPAFAVKLAGFAMGMQTDVALISQRATPRVALENGFVFEHTDLAVVLNFLFAATSAAKKA